uniref:Uncharacterized protein n=1 Tax=Dicentrarchus labrax TaxID=13489 RepID=A0A8C4FFG8_DICLA
SKPKLGGGAHTAAFVPLLPVPPGWVTLAPNTCTFIHRQSESLNTKGGRPFRQLTFFSLMRPWLQDDDDDDDIDASTHLLCWIIISEPPQKNTCLHSGSCQISPGMTIIIIII